MASKRRTTSILWSLSGNLLVLIALLSVAILLSTFYTASVIRRNASRNLIDRAMSRTEADLTSLFGPIQRILKLSRRWAESGLLDPNDNARLDALFMPVLDQAPQISAFNIGDARGRGFLLLRLGDRWRNRRVDAEAWGDRIEFQEWSDEGTRIREWTLDEPTDEERYDPRVRAWYRVAVDDAQRIEPVRSFPKACIGPSPTRSSRRESRVFRPRFTREAPTVSTSSSRST
jgi:hypothetical protein